MSVRELVVLGTASQVPTRERNHHALAVRWDDEMLLFDPGEGTQRQLLHAGLSAAKLTRILITHFHGDHCFGLPGVLQRIELDGPARAVQLCYPHTGQAQMDALLHLAATGRSLEVQPVAADEGQVLANPPLTVEARWLDHRIDCLGWRVTEPDSRRMLPDRLASLGIDGPDVGRLQRNGRLDVGGSTVRLEEVSEPRPGQSLAFVMDTRWCEAAVELAGGVDTLVCEATFLERHADLADRYRHLTAGQAARLAQEAGARQLVLTHFSQRYPDVEEIRAEAAAVRPDVVVARDLDRIPLAPRR